MQIISHLCLYFAENLCYPAVMKQNLSKIQFKFCEHRHLLVVSLTVIFCLLATSQFARPHSFDSSAPLNLSGVAQLSESEANHSNEPTKLPEDDDKKPAETPTFKSELWITAVNPGYDLPDARESGELIELQRIPGSTISSLSLAGYSLRYTNGSGKQVILYEFVEGSIMTGENLLMRLTRSPNSDQSDVTYSTTLARSAGPLELLYQGEPVDSVCWTGVKNGCAESFDKNNPTTLVRNLETGKFNHQSEYEPKFDPAHKSLVLPNIPDDTENKNQPPESGTPHCKGLEFSEIYAYYTTEKSEQFIELYNSTDNEITLNGCTFRYKKKNYDLDGKLKPGQYYAYYPASSFTLTKNPSSSNIIELYDEDGARVDIAEYYHGQKKSTSYARFYDQTGSENWSSTYAPTPNAENVFQEFRSCPEGKVINPDTGNCVKASNADTALRDCGEGKYRSPITNRCRSLETDPSTLKPCAPGYERNPKTNRCRKVTTENSGADYVLVPSTHTDKTVFIAAGIIALLVSLGVAYIIFQYRREILRAFRKIRQRLHHILEDLITRSRRFHRKK